MSKTITAVVAILIVLVLILFNTTFTVNFHEVAVKTRLGRPAGIVREPGLHFKLPFFIDSVAKLDTRQQFVKSPIKTVQTRDGQQVMVQAYMLWKVGEDDEEAKAFYNSYGSLAGAQRDLETLLQGGLGRIGGYAFDELIGPSSKLPEAEGAILEEVQSPANVLTGVVPISVGISRVAVQETLANIEESRGNSEANTIKQKAQAQAQIIRDFAEQWAAVIEARGNEEATRYYEQMREHADLAIFLSWLETLRSGLRGSTTFVTDMTKAPFHLIDLEADTTADGIPRPSSTYVETGSEAGQ